MIGQIKHVSCLLHPQAPSSSCLVGYIDSFIDFNVDPVDYTLVPSYRTVLKMCRTHPAIENIKPKISPHETPHEALKGLAAAIPIYSASNAKCTCTCLSPTCHDIKSCSLYQCVCSKPLLAMHVYDIVDFNNCNNLTNDTTNVSVVNLSSFQLTPAMTSLLSKGLNFCPTPGEPNVHDIRRDLDKFHVSLKRNHFFSRQVD